MARTMSFAVPLAALAALLTLVCSGYLLSQTGWQKTARYRIETGTTLDSTSTSLAEYMQGGQGVASTAIAAASAAVSAVTSLDARRAGELLSFDAAAAAADGADASPPSPASAAPPLALAAFSESEYDGSFLFARDEPVPSEGSEEYLRRLLKSLLGMAVLLKRTLVLPGALCRCRDAALTDCDGPPVAPFDCPLRIPLDAEAWRAISLVQVKPARFLVGGEKLPEIVRCSHLRVLLPDGMDDSELGFALRQYATTRWLEVTQAAKTFCGWDTRMPGNPARMSSFTAAADRLLRLDGHADVSLHVCTHYRGGTGEVLQFTNLGCNAKHVVTAPRERLPESIRNLPKDTDIMVTFATGSVATMACNWVATVRRAGVQEVLIGALDQVGRRRSYSSARRQRACASSAPVQPRACAASRTLMPHMWRHDPGLPKRARAPLRQCMRRAPLVSIALSFKLQPRPRLTWSAERRCAGDDGRVRRRRRAVHSDRRRRHHQGARGPVGWKRALRPAAVPENVGAQGGLLQ